MKVLLDTHAALWWFLRRPELPEAWRLLLGAELARGQGVAIAAISLWEIAFFAEQGRLALSAPVESLLESIESHRARSVLPPTADIAADSVRRPSPFPPDPADRLIAATARCRGLKLLTADRQIRSSGMVVLAA